MSRTHNFKREFLLMFLYRTQLFHNDTQCPQYHPSTYDLCTPVVDEFYLPAH
jgi:hypothetical protein